MYSAKHDGKPLFVASWETGQHVQEMVDVRSWADSHAELLGVCRATGSFIGDPDEISCGMRLELVAPVRDHYGNYVGTFPQVVVVETSGAGENRVKAIWRSCGPYTLVVQLTTAQHEQLMKEGRRICPSTAPWQPEPAIHDEGAVLHEPVCDCPSSMIGRGEHMPGCLWMEGRK